MRYYALIDGAAGAHGVAFPDLPGCTAMGQTLDEALANAGEALRDWAETYEARGREMPVPSSAAQLHADYREDLLNGGVLASVALVREVSRPVRVNLSLDSGMLAAIDAEASRLGVTRSGLVEIMARRVLPSLA